MTPPKSISRRQVDKGLEAIRVWREKQGGAEASRQSLATGDGDTPENLVSMLSAYAPKAGTPAARTWLDDRVGELTYLLAEQGVEAQAWKVETQSPTKDARTVKHTKLIEIEFSNLVSIREPTALMSENVVFVESGTPVDPAPEKRTAIRALKPRQNLPIATLVKVFSYLNHRRMDKGLDGAAPAQATARPRM